MTGSRVLRAGAGRAGAGWRAGARRRDRAAPPEAGGNGSGPEIEYRGDEAALQLLAHGSLEILGRLVEASNQTWYCAVSSGDYQAACVYKPVTGERPLWDFPTGTLAGREVAAYVVSRAASWDVVPPTVMRDGPYGPGMCQLWIDIDPQVDLMELARRGDHTGLRDLAVFDAVVNNADRKIGHLLPQAAAICSAAITASASPRTISCAPCCGSGAARACPSGRWRPCGGCSRCWRAATWPASCPSGSVPGNWRP